MMFEGYGHPESKISSRNIRAQVEATCNMLTAVSGPMSLKRQRSPPQVIETNIIGSGAYFRLVWTVGILESLK